MMVQKRARPTGLGIFVVAFVMVFWAGGAAGAAELAAGNLRELHQFFDQAESCAECHKRHYDEWKSSYHAQSMVTILGGFKKYIEETEREKGRFPNKEELLGCFDCHAPTLRFALEELAQQVARLVVEGKKEELEGFRVECSYCHTAQVTGKPEKNVYYGPIENPSPTAHESRYAPQISKAEVCRSCHESFYQPLEVYCSTVYDSWKGSRVSADKECQYCHMKAKDGPAAETKEPIQRVIHDHTFPGGHSPSILQEAATLRLAAKQAGANVSVTVTIKNLAGHQFPDT